MPIIVSRVAPNTPADLCIPRLNEGDQVLFINGRDVSQHTHEQVHIIVELFLLLYHNILSTLQIPDAFMLAHTTKFNN